jgi:hypothetical protein
MVVPVLRGPPKHALLGRALRENGEHKLTCAARAEGAMGEVAMVTCPNGENPHCVKRKAEPKSFRRDARPNGGEARQMQPDKWDCRGINDIVVIRSRMRKQGALSHHQNVSPFAEAG